MLASGLLGAAVGRYPLLPLGSVRATPEQLTATVRTVAAAEPPAAEPVPATVPVAVVPEVPVVAMVPVEPVAAEPVAAPEPGDVSRPAGPQDG
jgi:hypothetical protein